MTANSKPSHQVRERAAEVRRQNQAAVRASMVERFWTGSETARSAAAALGVSTRQFSIIRKRYASEGIDGLYSRHVGRPSNRRLPDFVRKLVLLIADTIEGATPTSVQRRLRDHYEFNISLESVRAWMIEADVWQLRGRATRRRPSTSSRRWHRWLRLLALR